MPRSTRILLAGLALLLAACGGTASVPQDSFYTLEIDDPARRYGEPLLDGVVEVPPLSADGLLSERALVYRENGPQLRQYNYHYWVGAPTWLLQDVAVSALRTANAANRVVTPELRQLPDWRVQGRIKQLLHVVSGDRAEVVVALELAVVDARDGDLLLLQTYREREPVGSTAVPAAVEQMQSALAAIMARFLDDLDAAVRGGKTG